MSQDYKAKYMKYKMKYIDLKTRQKIGGGLFSSVKTAATTAAQVAKQEVKAAAKEIGSSIKHEVKAASKDVLQHSVNATKTVSQQAITAAKDTAKSAIDTAQMRSNSMVAQTTNVSVAIRNY
jgi:hypothetical protein